MNYNKLNGFCFENEKIKSFNNLVLIVYGFKPKQLKQALCESILKEN